MHYPNINSPLISIIIAVKNAKDLLLETLNSIRVQTYHPIEVIVIDGNSSDGTQQIIADHQGLISHSVSEPDRGISDAFNKGLKLARGEYINFQGAGDLLHAPDSIAKLFQDLDNSYQLICGQIVRVKTDGVSPLWIAPKNTRFTASSLLFKMSLPHQGLFTHRSFFQEYGNFDLSLRFSMDYELLLRAYANFPKTIIKKIIGSRWREGGVGTNRIGEIFAEYHQIKLKHRIAPRGVLIAIDKYNSLKHRVKTLL